jgi:hypothetical protein
MLAYEPMVEEPAIDGVRLLGMEATRCTGSWPTFRHVFDVGHDAALYVELDTLGDVQAYAVGFNHYGDELLQAL